jgi:hypothetical protein
VSHSPPRRAAARALKGDGAEVPLLGSTVALQAPPKATPRFQIVSRE